MGNLFVCPFCAHETVTFDRPADCYRCVFCGWKCGVPEHKRRFLGVPLDVTQEQIDGGDEA